MNENAVEDADRKVIAANPGIVESGSFKVPVTYWIPLEKLTKQQLIEYIMQNRS